MQKPRIHAFILLLYLAMLPNILHSQTRIGELPDLQWYKTVAGFNSIDTYKDLEQDVDGSIFYAGSYNRGLYVGVLGDADTTVFDSVPRNNQIGNAYVVKLDETGEFQWAWIVRGDPQSLSYVSDLKLDGEGGVWIAGYYRGTVNLPFVGDLHDSIGRGFLLHFDGNGQASGFLLMTGTPKKLLIDSEGNRHLLVNVRGVNTVAIGNDTLADQPANGSFLAMVKIDSASTVQKVSYFSELGLTRGSFYESEMDFEGNLYLILNAFISSTTDKGEILFAGDTLKFSNTSLIKIDSDYQLRWIEPLGLLSSLGNTQIETSSVGIIYTSGDTNILPDFSRNIVSAYTTQGRQLWKVSASGYYLKSGGIARAGDYIYWTGSYQCDMSIDSIDFFIGDRQPWPFVARTGYLALINRHTGKLVWVRSDETMDQIKNFEKLVVRDDTILTIATRVLTSRFDADTLSLNIDGAGLPYNILLNFKEQSLPKLPEPPIENFDVQMWPNPSSAFVNIRLDDSWGTTNTKLEIYNLQGQLLRIDELSSQQSQIDVRRLSSQILVIVLRNDESGKRWTRKLVLQR